MNKQQMVGIVWVVLGIIYGVGGAMINEQWWWIVGGAMYAIVAVTTPLWTKLIPDDDSV